MTYAHACPGMPLPEQPPSIAWTNPYEFTLQRIATALERIAEALESTFPAGEFRETSPTQHEDGSASGRHPSTGSRADARRGAGQ